MPEYFEVVFLADPRFPGGTSTALASEMRALQQAQVSYALAPVKGPELRKSWPYHAEISEILGPERPNRIEPDTAVECTFCIIHHPTLFAGYPAKFPDIEADHVVLVLHHPMYRGTGEMDYDLHAVSERIRSVFGKAPLIAPVGPLVREQIDEQGHSLLPDDWFNLIDIDLWPERANRPIAPPIHIGRHSRPHPPKWPDTRDEALAVWPDSADIKVSMLGGGKFLQNKYGALPDNWSIFEFGSRDVKTFLGSLDFFVYFHSEEWVEAFGRSILEAMATGLVCILPQHFKPLFGPAAIYCAPNEVKRTIADFVRDPARYRVQSKRARSIVDTKFSLRKMVERLEAIDSQWKDQRRARPGTAAVATRRVKPIVFMSSNGVGLGHLTRLLSVAEALRGDFEPIFFTLSQGFRFVRDAGYHVEYRPFHRATGAENRRWNAALSKELIDVFAFFGPEAFVFDGNMPYEGILDALRQTPSIKSFWMRRGFWAKHHAKALERGHSFDAVIEPGDVASAFDEGPTAGDVRLHTFQTPPIIRKTRDRSLERKAACSALGFPPNKRIVGISLGSGANFDLSDVRKSILRELEAMPDILPVELCSPLAQNDHAADDIVNRISRYPMYPYLKAFDAMISTCGYNSFHENIAARLPTLWVPNEAAEMDLQIERARFAEVSGMAKVFRRSELQAAQRKLAEFLCPTVLARMRRKMAQYEAFEGAERAAEYIQDYSYLRKTIK